MKKVAPYMDVFLDVLSLRSGDNWEDKLREHVPTKDVFFLFWSTFASKSVWVEREWRLALKERGIDYIDPVPLEPVDLAHPPKELRSLHFHDAYITHILGSRTIEEFKKSRIRAKATSNLSPSLK